MSKLIGIAGDVAAIVGIVVCAVSGVARVLGVFDIMGLGTIALFTAGTALMVFACLAKLHLLTTRAKGV